MKRLLLVDDDNVVLRSYRERLSRHGFQVNTSMDATAAITVLRSARPDLVVLDLMMPGISGVEVLKFIRTESRLASLPVVILTNAYMNELGLQADALGVDRALLKAQCSPSVLMSVIDEILAARDKQSASEIRATPDQTEDLPTPDQVPLQPSPPSETEPEPKMESSVPTELQESEAELRTEAGADFMDQGIMMTAELRKLFQSFSRESDPEARLQLLKELYRKVRSLTVRAGLTDYAQITQTAAVFEAFLYVLIENPSRLNPSTTRTVASLVDFVEVLFQNALEKGPTGPLSARVLVVDDDPLSNRVVLSALEQAQIEAQSTEDPLAAWQWLNRERYDLFLLDIEMPGLNGFELCKRLRAVQGYEKTPVVYITNHNDFENRAKSTLSGGGDLIGKPVLPIELAAKVVMHLLKSRMAG